MREDVLEVLCDRPEKVMARAGGAAGGEGGGPVRQGLHVVADDGARGRAPKSAARLAERGHRRRADRAILPSLEDVFVSLIEARDRAEQPQEEVAR